VKSKPSPIVKLYESGGAICSTVVLLQPAAAQDLVAALQQALATPDAIASASWPREVCIFSVSPHTRGREQYLSVHLDSGPQPYSKWQLRRQAIKRNLSFTLALIGLVSSIRWLMRIAGV
jgi:hypothetical protein